MEEKIDLSTTAYSRAVYDAVSGECMHLPLDDAFITTVPYLFLTRRSLTFHKLIVLMYNDLDRFTSYQQLL